MLTQDEIAPLLGFAVSTVKVWRRNGLLSAHAYSDRNDYLYEQPGPDAPVKHKRKMSPNRVR